MTEDDLIPPWPTSLDSQFNLSQVVGKGELYKIANGVAAIAGELAGLRGQLEKLLACVPQAPKPTPEDRETDKP